MPWTKVMPEVSELEWLREAAPSERTLGYTQAIHEALDQALIDLEMGLFDLRLSGGTARQDTIRWPRQLWAKIASLAGYSSGTDDRPTDQTIEVRDIYRDQLATQLQRWLELAEADIASFNRLLVTQGLPPIIS